MQGGTCQTQPNPNPNPDPDPNPNKGVIGTEKEDGAGGLLRTAWDGPCVQPPRCPKWAIG